LLLLRRWPTTVISNNSQLHKAPGGKHGRLRFFFILIYPKLHSFPSPCIVPISDDDQIFNFFPVFFSMLSLQYLNINKAFVYECVYACYRGTKRWIVSSIVGVLFANLINIKEILLQTNYTIICHSIFSRVLGKRKLTSHIMPREINALSLHQQSFFLPSPLIYVILGYSSYSINHYLQ